MSLRFIDGFDHYNSIPQKWTTGSASFTSTGTRFSVGQAANLSGSSVTKGFDNQATWVVGVAFKLTATPITAPLIYLLDNNTPQVDLRMTAGSGIQVTRNGTQLGVTANGILSTDVWYYIELKSTIDNSTGSYEVRLNGVNVLSATGVDTQNTTNAYANQVRLGQVSLSVVVDDVYMCDGTGTTNNNFLGDVRVDTIFPTADGSITDFTPSTGTDNYAMVDDATPDSDSTYVTSNTLNAIDLYTFADLQSLTGSIYGIQSVLFARKDDAGTRSVAPAIKTGATTAVGSDFALAASYVYNLQVFETNPANSNAAWTISDVNNSEFGFKLTA